MPANQFVPWFVDNGWLLISLGLAVIILAAFAFYLIRRFLLKAFQFAGNSRDEERSSAEQLWLQIFGNVSSGLVGLLAAAAILSSGALIISRFSGLNLNYIFHPVWLWLLDPGLRLLLIIIGAWAIMKLANGILSNFDKFFFPQKKELEPEEKRRLATIKNIIGNLFRILIALLAVIMALKEAGFDISALITAAGIGGLALSLGAQDLFRDYISGFFLLTEDQIRVGDVVEINKIAGTVEQLTMRTVILRSLDGTVHVIPNRQVTTVSNMTKTFSRYVIDMEVAYKENVDRVIAVLKEIGEGLTADPQYRELILEPLEVLGVDKFGSSGVVIKIMITTKPLQQWLVGRELRRRIKNRFDELGIEIPFPHLSLYWGSASEPLAFSIEETNKQQEKAADR